MELLEITANFFYPGDKAVAAELDDMLWQTEWVDTSEEIPKEDRQRQTLTLQDFEVAEDTVFTEESIGFSFRYISEGRKDGSHTSPIKMTLDAVGLRETFGDDLDSFAQTAREIRKEHERFEPLGLFTLRPDLPVRAFSWIEGVGYWSSYDSFSGEYDGALEFYGRVDLMDLKNRLQLKLVGRRVKCCRCADVGCDACS